MKIDILSIKSFCDDNLVFATGLSYAKQDRVSSLAFLPNNNCLFAKVQGNNNSYDVSVCFGEEDIKSAKCSCGQAGYESGVCKHIAAALISYEKQQNNLENIKENNEVSEKVVKSLASIKLSKNKKIVNLMPVFDISSDNFGEYSVLLSLYIGEEKLYKIRKPDNFFEVYENGGSIEITKNFTFNYKLHTFSDNENNFLQFLSIIRQIIKQNGGQVNDRGFSLQGKTLLRVFELASLCENYKIIRNKIQTESKVYVADLDLPVSLSKEEDNYFIDFELWPEITPISADYRIVMYENNYYVISSEQAQVVKIFKYAKSKVNKTKLMLHDKNKIIEQVMPKLKYLSDLTVDAAIKQDVIICDLIVKVYLELTEEKNIKAKVIFAYDEMEFNHFAGELPDSGNQVLLRDKRKENEFIRLAAKMGFIPINGELHIVNSNKIYEFLNENLGVLCKKYEVFFSKSFYEIKVISPEKTQGTVSISSGDLFEFDINIQGISKEEIDAVILATREKKSFYRLNSGNFVNLKSKALEKISYIAENLDEKTSTGGKLNVPLHKAMYINTQEDDSLEIIREKTFDSILKKITSPIKANFTVPKCLDGVMREYQVEGFKWMKLLASYGFGGILADEMGLGKTLQSIALIISEHKHKKTPSLVIVPTSLLFNWQAEFEKFAPSAKIKVVYGNPDERKNILSDVDDCVAVITSYGLIRKDIRLYTKRKWAYCFIDEAQHIKNPNTVNAKSIKQIRADGYFAVTGTPIENNLAELWSIFDFIMPGYLFSRAKYRRVYEIPIIKKNDKESTQMLLNHIKPFVLRRMKSAVTRELPDKIETIVISDLEEEQKKLYVAYAMQAKNEIVALVNEKGFEKSKIEILARITRLRQLCCHPGLFVEDYDGGSGKLNTLLEIIENGLEAGKRMLIFSQFTSMLEIISEMLRQMGVTYFYLNGSVKSSERIEMCNAFNEGQRDVFLISLKAGGMGLNLVGADTVIHFDPWWNPAVENQATDRAHRIGQTKAVQVIKLVTKGTIEEKIQRLKEKKQELISLVLQEGGGTITSMNLEEIKELFD